MKVIAALLVLALACQQSLAGCPGCPFKQGVSDPEFLESLDRVLATQNSDDKVVKVLKATAQVVSGMKYTVEFETENQKTRQEKVCHSEYVLQPWVSKKPQVMSYHCSQKLDLDVIAMKKEFCAGCPVKHDPNEYDVSASLEQVLATQNSDDKVVKVLSVTTQVVAGVKYSVEFEAVNPKTNVKKVCHTDYVSMPWISKMPQVLSYKCLPQSLDLIALEKEICAGCPVEHDPQEYDVSESLDQVLASQNSDDKLVKVLKVTTQVVAGVKYSVEFESVNQKTNAKKICKTEYVSMPWISKMPQVLSYKCQPQQLELVEFRACAGCPVKQDPSSYDVSESLTKVLATQNSDDKLVKVLSVTTQVVSGIKYDVAFETVNRKTNAQKVCHTSYVEQPWLYKLPRVMSYHCQPKY